MKAAPLRPDVTHGYGAYSRGCRCDICRQAKANYMRARRAEARKLAEKYPLLIVDGVKHGAAHTYDEHGCRCSPCVEAARAWKAGRVA